MDKADFCHIKTKLMVANNQKSLELLILSKADASNSVSEYQKAAKDFPLKLKEIISDGAYSPDQVFNADETDLFWKKSAEKGICGQIGKIAGGIKVKKDSVIF